jgi:hypothetical protein
VCGGWQAPHNDTGKESTPHPHQARLAVRAGGARRGCIQTRQPRIENRLAAHQRQGVRGEACLSVARTETRAASDTAATMPAFDRSSSQSDCSDRKWANGVGTWDSRNAAEAVIRKYTRLGDMHVRFIPQRPEYPASFATKITLEIRAYPRHE